MTRVPLQAAAAARQRGSHYQQRQTIFSFSTISKLFWGHPASAVCTGSFLPAVNMQTEPNSGSKVTNV